MSLLSQEPAQAHSQALGFGAERPQGRLSAIAKKFIVGDGPAESHGDALAEEVRPLLLAWPGVEAAVYRDGHDGAAGAFDEHRDAAFELRHRTVEGPRP